MRFWCRYLTSDGARGRRDAWPARPGRARSPVKPSMAGTNLELVVAAVIGRAHAASHGARLQAAGAARRGTAGQRSCSPARAPGTALPLACRCDPALAGTTAARRHGPVPQRQAQLLPGADVLPQPPVPVFLARIRLHGGPRPSTGRAGHASPPNSRRKSGTSPARRSPASAARPGGMLTSGSSH